MPRRDQIRSGDQVVVFQARRELVRAIDAMAQRQGCSRADLLRGLMIAATHNATADHSRSAG